VAAVFDTAAHPYTEALLSAIPLPDPRRERARRRILLEGDLPSSFDIPSGCRFRARCPRYATLPEGLGVRCREEEPLPLPQGADHDAACHYPGVPAAV
jgi:peptide/nickel transport system ATP-binding protein